MCQDACLRGVSDKDKKMFIVHEEFQWMSPSSVSLLQVYF